MNNASQDSVDIFTNFGNFFFFWVNPSSDGTKFVGVYCQGMSVCLNGVFSLRAQCMWG